MKKKNIICFLAPFLFASFYGCGNSTDVAVEVLEEKPETVKDNKKSSDHSNQKSSADNQVDSAKKIDGCEIIATTFSSGRIKILYSYPYVSLSNGIVIALHRPPYKEVIFSEPGSKQMLIWKPEKERYPFSHFYNRVPTCAVYKKSKVITMFGMKSIVYLGYKRKDSRVPIVKFIATKEMKNPASFDLAQSRTMNRPLGLGFPLKLQGRQRFSGPEQWKDLYVTDSIKKKKIPVNNFEIPVGFNKVTDVGDFLAGGKLGIDDFFEYKFDK